MPALIIDRSFRIDVSDRCLMDLLVVEFTAGALCGLSCLIICCNSSLVAGSMMISGVFTLYLFDQLVGVLNDVFNPKIWHVIKLIIKNCYFAYENVYSVYVCLHTKSFSHCTIYTYHHHIQKAI